MQRPALLGLVCAGIVGLVIALALDDGGRAPAVVEGRADAATDTTTLRVALVEIGRRLGVRIDVDAVPDAERRVPRVPDRSLDTLQLEALLRALLVGQPFVLHYGPDARLRSVSVGESDPPAALRHTDATATAAVSPAAAAAIVEAPPASLQELRQVIDTDASSAVRVQALDEAVLQAGTNEQEVVALLDHASASADRMLAEHARVLREARSTPPPDLSPDSVPDEPAR